MQLVVKAKEISDTVFNEIEEYFLSKQNHPSDKIMFVKGGVEMKLFFGNEVPEEVATMVLNIYEEDKTSSITLYDGKIRLRRNDVIEILQDIVALEEKIAI